MEGLDAVAAMFRKLEHDLLLLATCYIGKEERAKLASGGGNTTSTVSIFEIKCTFGTYLF